MGQETVEPGWAGRRAPPPAAEALVRWPDAFGTRFTLFVDTEEEFDWAAPLSRTAHGTRAAAALTEGGRRLAGLGVPVTYLADWPIVADPRAVDILRGLVAEAGASVGTQLHAWVNPPFDEALTSANSFAGNLPADLETAKLDRLTAAITAAFGPPLAFRSGRYGIGPRTRALLAERGYRIDSSVRARYDYSAVGGPDFSAVGNHAYRAAGVVELPLTTVHTGALRGGGPALHRLLARVPRGLGAAARLRLLSRVALTPEDMPLADVLEAIRVAVREGVRVLNFSFHSPSLAPGHTPYVRDASELSAFWRWWDGVLALLARLNVHPASLAELIAAADAATLERPTGPVAQR